MNTQNVLAGALVAQVALAAVTWWPSGDTTVEAQPLVPGGANSITALSVTDGEGAPVTLEAREGRWFITSAADYPAEADKVAKVLEALAGITLRSPIATRSASHEPLGVTDDDAERVVSFTADGVEHSLLIGAASSRAVNARVDGGDEVHRLKGLSAFTFKPDAKGYQPANHLELDKEALSTFTLDNAQGSLSVFRGEDGWEADSETPMAVDAEALDKLLDDLSRLRLRRPVGTEVKPEHGLDGPDAVHVTWSVTEADANVPGALTIGAEADEAFYVKVDGDPFVITSPRFRLTSLVEADPAEILTPAAELMGAPTEEGPE